MTNKKRPAICGRNGGFFVYEERKSEKQEATHEPQNQLSPTGQVPAVRADRLLGDDRCTNQRL